MPVETVDRARLELDAETERVRGEIDELFGRLLVSRAMAATIFTRQCAMQRSVAARDFDHS